MWNVRQKSLIQIIHLNETITVSYEIMLRTLLSLMTFKLQYFGI